MLRDELGGAGMAAAHDRTGCLVHTAYLPPRLRWLARTRPQLMADVDYWMTAGDYLLWTFSGRRVISYSAASWTGMLNRRDLNWDPEWLANLPIDESHLSTLVDVDQPVHGLRKEWAGRWPALANVPWLPAVGDGAAANIGSGCDRSTEIALTVGTTAAMRVVVDPAAASVPAGLWLYRVDRRRGLLGGATTEGGNLFAWFRDTLNLPPAAELERALADRAPAAHGITILPFIGGERAPGWKEEALATFSGISLHTQALDLVQAGLEAISYRFAIIYGRLRPHLPHDEAHRIVASGGALLSSPAWLQIMADVLGQPVIALAEKELTGRGTTLLALEALGEIGSAADLPAATGRIYEPDAERHARHQEALEQQVALYELLYP
jgi:gluconokinase